jgi:hypothetical protein
VWWISIGACIPSFFTRDSLLQFILCGGDVSLAPVVLILQVFEGVTEVGAFSEQTEDVNSIVFGDELRLFYDAM